MNLGDLIADLVTACRWYVAHASYIVALPTAAYLFWDHKYPEALAALCAAAAGFGWLPPKKAS